jgi:tRNA threonylcarbamoyladenosine biosynthesis protein TsaB
MILALETSSQAASCALWREGKLLGESYGNAGLTHSQTIMPMVEDMLRHTRTSLEEVEVFAVSTGPGSFTGLRIGLSAVKGMAMALGKPCAGISTLHGLAANVRDFRGTILPVLDARRGQVYAAAFRSDGAALTRLWEDEALSLADLEARIVSLDSPKLLVGDGAVLCREALADLPDLIVASPALRYQRASSVAALAAELPPAALVSAGELAPVYLRLPQAERELNNKNKEDKP